MSGLNIVMVGETMIGSRTPQRRSAFEKLGHRVHMVSINPPQVTYETRPSLIERLRYRLRVPGDPASANAALLAAAHCRTDVIWVENARMIRAATLVQIRRQAPGARLIWYSEDDTMNPRHRSRWMEGCIPLYDLWVTTKSFNAHADEVPSLGARRVLVVNNGFDPASHTAVRLTDEDRRLFGAEIAFVGTFEEPRAASMMALARSGLTVRVWGNGWTHLAGCQPGLHIEGRPVYNEEYAKVCAASKINLAFLRKFNRDLQTCRSVEIPACGAFMLHERNAEIAALFVEGIEAAYFGDNEELAVQCRKWLADDGGRQRVAATGRTKALASLSHDRILSTILSAAGVGR